MAGGLLHLQRIFPRIVAFIPNRLALLLHLWLQFVLHL